MAEGPVKTGWRNSIRQGSLNNAPCSGSTSQLVQAYRGLVQVCRMRPLTQALSMAPGIRWLDRSRQAKSTGRPPGEPARIYVGGCGRRARPSGPSGSVITPSGAASDRPCRERRPSRRAPVDGGGWPFGPDPRSTRPAPEPRRSVRPLRWARVGALDSAPGGESTAHVARRLGSVLASDRAACGRCRIPCRPASRSPAPTPGL